MFRPKSSSVRPRPAVIAVSPADDKCSMNECSPDIQVNTDDVFTHYYDNSLLYHAMRPLIWSLWITGMYFEREPSDEDWADMEEEHRPVDQTRKSRRKRHPAYMIYSVIVLVILWLNLMRTCSGLAMEETLGPVLFIRVLLIAWSGLCTLNYTTMFLGCLNTSSGLTGFFIRWRRFQNSEYGQLDLKYARKNILLYTTACWSCTVIQLGVFGYGLYFLHPVHVTMTPLPENYPGLDVYRALYLVVHFYLSAAWTFPIAMEFFLSVLLSKEYKRCNRALSTAIDKHGQMTSCLETYRVWHHHLCALTQNVDSIVGLQTGGMLVTCMVEVCVILYNLIWYKELASDSVLLSCFVFWLFTATGKLGLIAIGGVIVNEAVSNCFASNSKW